MTPLRRTLLAAISAGFGLALLPATAEDGIVILDAYARFLPGAKAGAIYLTIENRTGVEDRLIAVQTDLAEMADLHRSTMTADGMMTMEPLPDGLPVAVAGQTVLATGGDHIMVMGLRAHPADGDMIPLALTFRDAGKITLEVPVDNRR
jgi:copper(I)-binding protein